MKKKKWFLASALCAMMAMFFVACDNDDDPTPGPDEPGTPDTEQYTAGFYIINRGKSKSNNSCISYYDLLNKKITGHVFETANGRKLGDSAQEFFQYGSKIYIPVYNSMIIEVIDAETLKSLKSIEPKDADGKGEKPRAITASGDYVYATLYNGYVARIDTATLEIDKQVKVGMNPDKLSAQGDVLYTANSGGLNSPDYDKTISVVNLNTFEVERNVEVIINPTRVITDSEGDAYVISMGNYSKDPATLVPNTLQYFKKGSSDAKEICHASVISICNDTIYGVYKQYGSTTYDFFTYDAKAEKMISDKFVTDDTVITGDPQEIDIDPLTGNVYVSVGGSNVNGDMYIFSPEGKLINKFDTEGLYPQGVIFVYGEQQLED
ncbi:YncE family protein [Parabacteroides bouchesdurhonensis]|uniref:YncE family protein n=1 Tax=Parabacteroides bouchesdurhonensis TaxID=1936995 RepID=UPI000E4EBD94|nr:DUF5074 domain-containing protein [Parabacteroides bouchesdurhonensis]RHJ92989.1 hypothetical protein DW095_06440 [Bacteroides sp. AM07-16]